MLSPFALQDFRLKHDSHNNACRAILVSRAFVFEHPCKVYCCHHLDLFQQAAQHKAADLCFPCLMNTCDELLLTATCALQVA